MVRLALVAVFLRCAEKMEPRCGNARTERTLGGHLPPLGGFELRLRIHQKHMLANFPGSYLGKKVTASLSG